MFKELGVALGKSVGVGCTATNELGAAIHDDIDADKHRVLERRQVDAIKVRLSLGVHLLHDIRGNSQAHLLSLEGGHELRGDAALVQEGLNGFLLLGPRDDDENDLCVLGLD